MKDKWGRTYSYLNRFKQVLTSQAAYIKYHEESGNPFYSQYNIGEYTFEKYKTVWKQMTNDIVSCVISHSNSIIGFKPMIPLHTTAFFSTVNEAEAHYLCAIINSTSVRAFIKSYSSAGRGFGTPSVMKHVGIPKFDDANPIHSDLAGLSKKLHALKREEKEEDIPFLEKENDELVKSLFGIK